MDVAVARPNTPLPDSPQRFDPIPTRLLLSHLGYLSLVSIASNLLVFFCFFSFSFLIMFAFGVV